MTAKKCILYTVTWKRDNIEIKNSPTHVVKVEGERHTLLIKWTKPSDAGTYTVTATNEVGEMSSSATLFIKSGECFMVNTVGCHFSVGILTESNLFGCWLVDIPTQPLYQLMDHCPDSHC